MKEIKKRRSILSLLTMLCLILSLIIMVGATDGFIFIMVRFISCYLIATLLAIIGYFKRSKGLFLATGIVLSVGFVFGGFLALMYSIIFSTLPMILAYITFAKINKKKTE